jgi:hypothetical protein
VWYVSLILNYAPGGTESTPTLMWGRQTSIYFFMNCGILLPRLVLGDPTFLFLSDVSNRLLLHLVQDGRFISTYWTINYHSRGFGMLIIRQQMKVEHGQYFSLGTSASDKSAYCYDKSFAKQCQHQPEGAVFGSPSSSAGHDGPWHHARSRHLHLG